MWAFIFPTIPAGNVCDDLLMPVTQRQPEFFRSSGCCYGDTGDPGSSGKVKNTRIIAEIKPEMTERDDHFPETD